MKTNFLLVLLALCLAAASCSNPVNPGSPVDAQEEDPPVGDAEEAGGTDSPDAQQEDPPVGDAEEAGGTDSPDAEKGPHSVPDLMKGTEIVYEKPTRKATVGDPFTHPLTVSGVSGDTGTITYISSNPKVAKVDENGKVTPLSKGKTTITATKAKTSTHTESSTSYELTVVEEEGLLRRAWNYFWG